MGFIAKTTATSKLIDLLDKIQKQSVDIKHDQDKNGKVSLDVTHPKKISKIVLDERVGDIINILKKELTNEFQQLLDERFIKHINLRHTVIKDNETES